MVGRVVNGKLWEGSGGKIIWSAIPALLWTD